MPEFNYNHITLVGRLTADPEVSMVDKVPKTTFRLWVDRPYKREDGSVEADCVPVVMWGKLSDVAQKYLRKGVPCLVEGRLQVVEYDGTMSQKWVCEVMGENFQVLENIHGTN
jgi:single-strand DNA-binding protein